MWFLYTKKHRMITVRTADVADVDIIAPMFDAYRVFYKQPGDLIQARNFISVRLEKNEAVIFLAYWNSQPAGFTQLYPIFSSVKLRRSWLLNDLFVQPDYRKKGIGSALLDAAKEHGRQTGANTLTLETAPDNHTAQKLYEANGWRKETSFYYSVQL